MPLSAGETLGPYEIIELIGKGGMGEVYRARDTKLKREVAIKVLPEAFTADPARMMRFQREAEVLASLDHPNIGAIYGLVEANGTPSLVLALVEGPTLDERIAAGPLPLEEALSIARQIVAALEYAQERGVIHRDLKPANVKITPEGSVKVLDFGLAKVLDEEQAAPSGVNSPTLTLGHTRAGLILGTAAYMSPEQAVGKIADRRSDIFSFGAVLYEMLTGSRAFSGDSAPEILVSVAKDDPDWSKLPAATPRAVRELLRRCLMKDRKQRLQAIGEARIILENPSTEEPSESAVAPAKPRAAWLPWTVAGVLALAALAFAGLWLRPAPLPEVVRFEIHAPPGSSLPLGTPAISPDGRTIAYTVTDPDGISRIHLRPIDRVETRALPGTEGAAHPFWSRDGRSLAFVSFSDLHLKRVDVDGGAPLDLTAVTGPWHGAWNQNGDILFALNSSISRISSQGGPATQVLGRDLKAGTALAHPFFLPDGKRFLVSDGKSILLATLGSANRTRILDNVDNAPILAPMPGGKTYLLYLRGTDLFAQDFDQSSGAVRGTPMHVASNLGHVAVAIERAALGVSPSGVLAYQTVGASPTGQLTWFDRSGKQVGSLPADASGDGPRLSPDGLSVVMTRAGSSGNVDIWVTDLARKSPTRITFDPGLHVSPVWSPDGRRLAFLNLGIQPGTRIVDANDSAKSQPLGVAMGPSSWSPDGQYLLGTDPNGPMILAPLTGNGKPVPAGSPNGNSFQGHISPDGKYIAFTSDQSGRNEVYVQPMPPGTGQSKVSINGGSAPRWRHDGKELFFVSAQGAMMAVDVKPGAAFSAGIPRQLFQIQGVDLTAANPTSAVHYDVRADGQQFLVFVPQQEAQDSPITVVLNWWAELEK